MTTALLFAGGVGRRMNTKALPKQFLEINGKPIIIHTVEKFDNHPLIDAICIVCVEDWLEHLKSLLEKFKIKKVRYVVSGGDTALNSQYNGLKAISENASDDGIVLIHDGVRPIIDDKLISECIASVKEYGSGICVAPATETIIRADGEGFIKSTVSRSECMLARAPQCFYTKEILEVHEQAIKDNNHDHVDSATMMLAYGKKLHIVNGPAENLKVTTPLDFYICKALLDAKESSELFNL